MQQKWIYPLACILLLVVLVGYIRITTQQTDRNCGVDSDGRQYVTMAGETALFGKEFARIAPFCYRVATPWMVKNLPGDDVLEKFRLAAWIDVVLMLLLVVALFRALGFSPWDALLGMALYGGVFWTVKFAFYSPCYIDHQSLVLALLILWVMAKGWWPLLPILVFVASFQKETAVMLVPVYLIYYLQTRGWRWWPVYVLGLLSVAAILFPYFILHNSVRPLNAHLGSPFYAIQDSWRIISSTAGYPRIFLVAIFSGLGMLPLILLSHFRWTMGYLRKNLHWLVMVLIGTFLLMGGKDKARLFLHMLPAIVVIAVAAVRDLRACWPRMDYWMWLGMVLVLHFFAGHHFSGFQDFGDYIHTMVP